MTFGVGMLLLLSVDSAVGTQEVAVVFKNVVSLFLPYHHQIACALNLSRRSSWFALYAPAVERESAFVVAIRFARVRSAVCNRGARVVINSGYYFHIWGPFRP